MSEIKFIIKFVTTFARTVVINQLSPSYNLGTYDTAVGMVNAVEGGDAVGGITVFEDYFFIRLVDTKIHHFKSI